MNAPNLDGKQVQDLSLMISLENYTFQTQRAEPTKANIHADVQAELLEGFSNTKEVSAFCDPEPRNHIRSVHGFQILHLSKAFYRLHLRFVNRRGWPISFGKMAALGMSS
jgi:hypothetical protein